MFKKIKKNKKGQTGETITWVVATVIIIVVLIVAIFFTKLVINPDKVATSAQDRQKNFLATESITSFLENPKTVELIQNKDYPQLELQIKNLLKILPGPPAYSESGWNFQLFDNGDKKIDVKNLLYVVPGDQFHYFNDTFYMGQDRLLFWQECAGSC